MKPVNSRTLVLNSDYTAHSVVTWDRAIVLVIINEENPKLGAKMIEFYKDDFILDSKGNKYPVPAIVVLGSYVKKKKKLSFGRKNILLRDKLQCQYCGQKKNPWELTYDHVIPRSKWDQKRHGTPTTWTNIVACCLPCNKKKANKTLQQAGMKLLKQPIEPTGQFHIHGLSLWAKCPVEWEPYLPKIYKDFAKGGV